MLALQSPTAKAIPGNTPTITPAYQERAESFWQAEVTATYRAEAGLSDEINLADLYRNHADLFSREQVCALIEAARFYGDDSMRHIAEFATMRYLRHVALPFDELFGSKLGPSTILWDEEPVPFFATTRLLSAEPDAARRRLLYEGRSQSVAQCNFIRRQRWDAIATEVMRLGYDTYYTLCNELRALRLVSLQFMAQSFLKETAVPYFNALTRWSQAILGVERPDAADMFYLMRGTQFDHLFPPEKLETAVYDSARFLGISLADQPGLEIDLAARPGKAARPFCAFVQVPHQIKLVINPIGGHQDYKAVFHELGHALHGLHIPENLPFATRYLGDDSVGEAFAFLFEQFPENQTWLREALGVSDGGTYAEYMRFLRLLFVRRCAAKLLYENQLHTGAEEPATLYASLLQEHLGLNISAAYHLLDVDDGFYNAQYFRAWMLSAQMTARLTSCIGEEWITSAATGAFLRPLWQKGQPSAEIIAILLGENCLNPDALIRSFQG